LEGGARSGSERLGGGRTPSSAGHVCVPGPTILCTGFKFWYNIFFRLRGSHLGSWELGYPCICSSGADAGRGPPRALLASAPLALKMVALEIEEARVEKRAAEKDLVQALDVFIALSLSQQELRDNFRFHGQRD